MPESHRRAHPYPGKREHSLSEAAKIGQLIKVRCNLCRRTVYFMASDLVPLLGPDHPARSVPFPCHKCQNAHFIDVKLYLPSAGDYGHLLVRRPGEVKHIQTWQTVRLGDSGEKQQQPKSHRS